ncbi:hypothetical protein GDO86_005501 [Hymenochirus boettgeri]|uniref:Rho guanine nucleotide exchange factor 37 n=1 Tax=Hymenochirus boettgeri TaxID=247094 RepID=A0A8T2J695_9PIPI|nr:hypothetical protein GDO86_005501 [Hymenochirus boettgeri]
MKMDRRSNSGRPDALNGRKWKSSLDTFSTHSHPKQIALMPPFQRYPYRQETPSEESITIMEPTTLPDDSDTIYDDAEDLRINLLPAVEELIRSEEYYVDSLNFVISTVQPKLEKIPGVDAKSLFCNINDILMVATLFLTELKKTQNIGQNQLTAIGEQFQEFSKTMQTSYSMYCWEYHRSLSLLEQYKENNTYLQIQEALNSQLSLSRPLDISFYLVMPVQRITKYPLLLQKILESAPPESCTSLQKAYSMMQEVNQNINEYKRCKEAGSKYNRLKQQTLVEKMASLSTSTISKKYKRVSQKLMQETGFIPKKEDKEFDDMAETFHTLASAVKLLKQNVGSYVQNLEVFMNNQPNVSSLEIPQSSAYELQNFSQTIYPEFKKRLEVLVLQPLIKLSECLKGPKNLIRKRTDKLLDYEKLEIKLSETGKLTYEEEDVKNAYLGFQSRLLSELPHCMALTLQWLYELLQTFIDIQQQLAEKGRSTTESIASQMPNSMLSEAEFRKWAEDSIRNAFSLLTDLNKKFEEEMPIPAVQDHDPTVVHQVQRLLKRHGNQKEIYQVTNNINGSRDMDLTLHRFEVVAVLQKLDTKGNNNRWLVDTAEGKRGFVPCNKLQPYQSVHTPRTSQNYLDPHEKMEKRRHSTSPLARPHSVYTEPQNTTPIFQTIAGYEFTARSSYEISIKVGEPVTLLEPHDKKGSTEWSLVEVDGQRGYVPSNYLVTVPVQKSYGWVVD